MMFTVVDQSTTILVTYEDDNFIVENLLSRDTIKIPTAELISTVYKYFDGFERRFKSAFPKKDALILTKNALRKIDDLIYFNRIDS